MRIFINYIGFSRDEAKDLVFNNSNNNDWPTMKKYLAQRNSWQDNFQKQEKVINDYINYLQKETKLGNEHFVIRIVNDINTKLKALNAKDKKDKHWLKRVEQRKKGVIGVDLYDPILEEIKNLREGLDFPEYPALREQLKTWFNDNNPSASLKRVREIFAHYPIGQWETIYDHFNEWNNKRDYPIKEINDILEQWENNNHKVDKVFDRIEEIKSLQIQLLERNDNYIRFVWRVPITIETNVKGKEVKNRVFPSIPYYFFFLNGTFYEVVRWKQTDWQTAEVLAEESIFYSHFYWVLTDGISGIIRNSPVRVGGEVCGCFDTDVLTVRNKFICNLRLVFDTWKISKSEYGKKNTITDNSSENAFSIIAAGIPVKLRTSDEALGRLTEYLGAEFVNPALREWSESYRESGEEERRREGNRRATQAEIERSNGAWNKFCQIFTGDAGVIYLLLNRRLKGGSWYSNTYWNVPDGLGRYNSDNGSINAETKDFKIRWMRAGKWDDSRKQTSLEEFDYFDFFKKEGLMNEDGTITEMYHPMMEHLIVTFMWRNQPVWEGPYHRISADLRVDESVSAAGNCYTISAGGQMLFSVKELVSAKVGGNDKTSAFWSTLITVGTTIATAYATAGMSGAGAKVAKTAIGAGFSAGGQVASRGVSNLLGDGLNVQETSITMTIHEFKHKFMISGTHPLSMNLSFSKEAFSRYRNSRELLGPNYSTFINVPELGSYLQNPGFIRFTEIFSLGTVGETRSEWFKEKLLEGVFLHEKPGENYQKKLSEGFNTASVGGIIRKGWNEIVSSERRSFASGFDNVSQAGSPPGLYVWKDSRLWVGRQNSDIDIFPWLMDELQRRRSATKDGWRDGGDFWSYIHPASWTEKVKIPSQYLNDTNPKYNGEKTCKIFGRFHFYSSDMKTKEKDEMYATEFEVTRSSLGDKGMIDITIVGNLTYENKSPNPGNVPPAGTLPVNPLGGARETLNPTGLQGTVPPGSNSEIIITPPTGGGLGEIDINIEEETQTEPPEVQQQIEEEIQEQAETQTQNETDVQTGEEYE